MSKQGRRRLEDLWANGETVVLDDGRGAVEVWMAPVNEPEEEIAHAYASAARAGVLLLGRDPTSTLVMEVTDEVLALSDEFLVEYLSLHEQHRFVEECEAEEAAAEEWSKDDYLTGLQDRWEPPPNLDGSRAAGLKDRWAVDNDDPEAAPVFAELKRYLAQVDARLAPIRQRIGDDLARLDRSERERRAIEKFVETKGQMAWTEEFRRCLMWLGTREPDDHLAYYYPVRATIDRLPTRVLAALQDAALRVNVDVLAGKGLRLLRGSSNPSASPAAPEMADSSGPVAAEG